MPKKAITLVIYVILGRIQTMFITGVIIAITSLVSIIIFNKPQEKYKLTYSPYKLKHFNEWYRAFTHMFIHADWGHLIFNMMTLYFFGDSVNSSLVHHFGTVGNLYFVLLYIGGGLFACLPAMLKHNENDLYQSLGASGAVFSVLMASVLIDPTTKLFFFFIPIGIPGFIMGPLIILMEYFMSKRRTSNIAHDAHLGGAIFGIVFLCILRYEFAVEFYQSLVIGIKSWFN